MASPALLTAIQTLSTHPSLSTTHLSAPLLTPQPSSSTTTNNRDSTSSTSPSTTPTQPTPADLRAELAHYRDLFTKLRFSYTEQVTKERLLKALVADPPALVAPGAIAALEDKLAQDKAALQAAKASVAGLLEGLERRSRGVARLQTKLEGETGALAALPEEIERLQKEVQGLRATQPEVSGDARMNLGLGATADLVEGRRVEVDVLRGRTEEVRRALEARRGDVERMGRELEGLEERKRGAVAEAVEMRDRKGGRGAGMDAVEARGRWLRASEVVLQNAVAS